METIMDFKDVRNIPGPQITTDTSKERALIVTPRNGNCFKFKYFASGLYYYNTMKNDDYEATNETHKTKQSIKHYSMLQTVNNNK